MPDTAPGGSPPFTPRAKKVLELSLRVALQLGHSYIGTEHMLLGLLREGEGVGATVLVNLAGGLGRVRQQVIQLMLGYGYEDPSGVGPGEQESSAPRCPQCRAPLTEVAVFRTMSVPPEVDGGSGPTSLNVVYCTRCGNSLQHVHVRGAGTRSLDGCINAPQ
jgi:hypothetical protein